jgi:exonuclease III
MLHICYISFDTQIRVACFNVNGLNHRKFVNLTAMMDDHNISACIITETKWTPDSPKWYLDEDTHNMLNTDYSDIQETPNKFHTVQRGGVCIITTVS